MIVVNQGTISNSIDDKGSLGRRRHRALNDKCINHESYDSHFLQTAAAPPLSGQFLKENIFVWNPSFYVLMVTIMVNKGGGDGDSIGGDGQG